MASWKIDEAATVMESQVDLGSDFSSLHDERLTFYSGSYNTSYTSSRDDINNISGSVDGDECMSSIKTTILANNIVEVFAADKLVTQDKSLRKKSATVNTENSSDPEASYSDLEFYPDESDPERPVSDLESCPSESNEADPEGSVLNLESGPSESDGADPEKPVSNLESGPSECDGTAADKLVAQDKSLCKNSVTVNTGYSSDSEASYSDLEFYPDESDPERPVSDLESCPSESNEADREGSVSNLESGPSESDGADPEKLFSNLESDPSESDGADPEGPVSNLEFCPSECDGTDSERQVSNLEAYPSECEGADSERSVLDLESYHCECNNFFDVPSIVGEDVPLCHSITTDTPSDIHDEALSSAQCSQLTDFSQVLIMPSPRAYPSLDCWTRKMQRENSLLVLNSDWKITYRSNIVSIPNSVYTCHQALQADVFYSYDSTNSSIDEIDPLSTSAAPFN